MSKCYWNYTGSGQRRSYSTCHHNLKFTSFSFTASLKSVIYTYYIASQSNHNINNKYLLLLLISAGAATYVDAKSSWC